MIDVIVGSRVRLAPSAELAALRASGALAELLAEHEHLNPDHGKAKHFGIRKRPPMHIVTWREEESGALSFPRGSLSRVREALRLAGPGSRVDDRRTRGDGDLGSIPPHRPPSGCLWPHQEMLAGRAIAAETALVRSAAGSGKTTAALAFASRVNLPTLVIVHSASLFRQWIERCTLELGVPERWVGQIRGSRRRLGPITVGMQRTLYGCAHEVARAFGVVIVDEVHRAASRTFLEVVDAMTARYRLGVSDDERRSDGKEFLIYDMFGPVAGEATHDELVAAGYIMDVRVRVVPTEARADWYPQLKDSEKLLAYDSLMSALAADPARNMLAIRDVPAQATHGHQVAVFTARVEHARELDRTLCARGVPSGFVLGEEQAESAETLRRLRSGKVRVVVGTFQALGTGVDMPRLTRGVFAAPIANSDRGRSQFKQYRGRFTRSADGKGQPEITYLWDRHVFGARPLRHLCRWAKDVKVEWRGGLVPGRAVLKEIEADET